MPQSIPKDTIPITVEIFEFSSRNTYNGPPLSPLQLSFFPSGSYAQYCPLMIPSLSDAKFTSKLWIWNLSSHSCNGIVWSCVFNSSFDIFLPEILNNLLWYFVQTNSFLQFAPLKKSLKPRSTKKHNDSVIDKPMDLKKIKKKTNDYQSFYELYIDVELIFHNCLIWYGGKYYCKH